MKKKTRLPSTKLITVNADYIAEHITDKALWNAKWNIFEYDGWKAELTLDYINVSRKYVAIEMKVYPDGRPWRYEYTYITVSLTNEENRQGTFVRALCSSFNNLMRLQAKAQLRDTPAYNELSELDDASHDSLKEAGERYCDEHDIKDDDIRDAVIDKFTDEATNLAEEFLSKNEDANVKVSAIFADWLDCEKASEEFRMRAKDVKKGFMRGEWMRALNAKKKVEKIGIEEYMLEQGIDAKEIAEGI